MIPVGTKVSYVVAGTKRAGSVLVHVDDQRVLVSQEGAPTTQRLVAEAALTATAPPPAPPPPVSQRPWAKPPLETPLVKTILPSSSRLIVPLDPLRDHIIRIPEPIRQPYGILLDGGRNRIIEGGVEIGNDIVKLVPGDPVDKAHGLRIRGGRGTLDCESLLVKGKGIGQALVLECPETIVQIHRFLLEPQHEVGYVHTDAIQTWAGPKALRLNSGTMKTAGVGLQTQPHQYGSVALATWEYRNLNIVQTTAAAYALWKNSHSGGWWRTIQQNVWVKAMGNLAWANSDGIDGWQPGGPDLTEGDFWQFGIPPGGDFETVGSVGIGR